jgi:hypothetical protein
VQEDDAVRQVARHAHVVGDEQHGAPLFGEAADDAHDLLLELGVERGGGFVEEKRARLHAERAGDGGALLLAARQLRGVGVALVVDADLVEDGARAVLDLGRSWPSTVTGASMTFCRIVMCAQRLNCWNTIDRFVRMRRTCSGRRAARRPLPRHVTGSPSKRISPCWLSSSRLAQRRSVDLPDPEEPISDTTSPARAVRSTPRRTSSAPKLLCRPVISITGGDCLVTCGRSPKRPGKL